MLRIAGADLDRLGLGGEVAHQRGGVEAVGLGHPDRVEPGLLERGRPGRPPRAGCRRTSAGSRASWGPCSRADRGSVNSDTAATTTSCKVRVGACARTRWSGLPARRPFRGVRARRSRARRRSRRRRRRAPSAAPAGPAGRRGAARRGTRSRPPDSMKTWSSQRAGWSGSSIRRTGPSPRIRARGRHAEPPAAPSSGVPPTVSMRSDVPGFARSGRTTRVSVPVLPSPGWSAGTRSANRTAAPPGRRRARGSGTRRTAATDVGVVGDRQRDRPAAVRDRRAGPAPPCCPQAGRAGSAQRVAALGPRRVEPQPLAGHRAAEPRVGVADPGRRDVARGVVADPDLHPAQRRRRGRTAAGRRAACPLGGPFGRQRCGVSVGHRDGLGLEPAWPARPAGRRSTPSAEQERRAEEAASPERARRQQRRAGARPAARAARRQAARHGERGVVRSTTTSKISSDHARR